MNGFDWERLVEIASSNVKVNVPLSDEQFAAAQQMAQQKIDNLMKLAAVGLLAFLVLRGR